MVDQAEIDFEDTDLLPDETSFEDTLVNEDVARDALEDKLKDQLAAFNDDTTDADLSEDDIDPNDVKPETDEEKVQALHDAVAKEEEESARFAEEGDDGDVKIDDDPNNLVAKDDREAAAGVTVNDDAPTLPDAFRRSLLAYGYTDDKINTDLNNLGLGFVEAAGRMHANRNAELAQYASAGRLARDKGENPGQLTMGQDLPAQSPEGLPQVDIKAMTEQFGDEDMVNAIAGPVNAVIAQLNPLLEKLQAGAKTVEEANVEKLNVEINGFFSGSTTQGYTEVYGKNDDTLSQEQVGQRNALLDTADALMAGYKAQGRVVTVSQALGDAHDIISKDFTETAVRQGIRKQAKARNQGITNKPSSRKQVKTDKVQTRSQLETKVGGLLGTAFG